ncbi:MAG TPA: HWE histidine kinase domain-containing protein [Allosphingosinicella sp.]|nr:HWE histidine kinase domain-containing protein [Allosphingosinicella sp.]
MTSLASETDSFEDALRACLEAICDLTGWPVGHALITKKGDSSELVSTAVWHEAWPGAAARLREATESLIFRSGVGLPGTILASGEPVWVPDADNNLNFPRKGLGFEAAFGFPVKSEGKILAILEFFTQSAAAPDPDLLLMVRTVGEQVARVLERKRTEAHQRLLVNELNHRVKNTLAIVQSIASQTFKGEAIAAAVRQAFESRLAALASAHDLLTAENWEAAPLREVVDKSGFGCGAPAGRVTVEGPDIRVQPRTAVSIAMALHELWTNAVKYGALSGDSGRIAVRWQISDSRAGKRLQLRWQEQGGPPVVPPARRGFGSRLIERGLAAELGARAELNFHPAGLLFTLDMPLPDSDGEERG